MTFLTPTNSTEAIIEPFWNSNLSGLSEWEINSHIIDLTPIFLES